MGAFILKETQRFQGKQNTERSLEQREEGRAGRTSEGAGKTENPSPARLRAGEALGLRLGEAPGPELWRPFPIPGPGR